MCKNQLRKIRVCLVGLTQIEEYELTPKIEAAFTNHIEVFTAPGTFPIECSKDCTCHKKCLRPDFMILGRQAIEKKTAPECPFLALINESDEDTAILAAELGADGYLPHKCNPTRLRTTILMISERKTQAHKHLARVIAKLEEIEEATERRVVKA